MILVVTDKDGTEVAVGIEKIEELNSRGRIRLIGNEYSSSDFVDLHAAIDVRLLPDAR